MSFLLFFVSFVICAFGQPARMPVLGILAGFIGYTLFFAAIQKITSSKRRFFSGVLYFAAVSSIQLSWMVSTKYQGLYIIFVYLCLLLSLGVQFGILTALVPAKPPFKAGRILACASLWTIFEWARIFAISGFTWNPVGITLASTHYSLGLAAVAGIYGLTFYVIFVNLWGYRSLFLEKKRSSLRLYALFALFPYLFGFCHQMFWESRLEKQKPLSAVLVQTAMKPEEKEPYYSFMHFVPPTEQWTRILLFLKEQKGKKIDLIVLPEVALPFRAFKNYYYLESFTEIWENVMGLAKTDALPPLIPPLATMDENYSMRLTNSYWAQAIANHFDAEVIVGFDDFDGESDKSYNAAFHYKPGETNPERYEKRLLVPLVEYLPYEWCRSLVKRYGITDFFEPGKEAKVFQGKVPLGVSICYEETYSHLIRESRLQGAEVFVNITNDGWFPDSKLPEQHFDHGIVRGVENGVPILRATNTGVTGAIDCFGRVQKTLSSPYQYHEEIADAIHVELPLGSYQTLYTYFGDGLIIGLSVIFLGFFLRKKRSK